MTPSKYLPNLLRQKNIRAFWAIAALAVGIPAVCCAYIFTPLAVDAPIVTLAAQVHDFGTVLADSKSQCTFTCRNTLWDVLFIDKLDKSCGCTSAQTDRSFVLPGQTFTVAATLSAPAYAEELSSHITVHGHAGRSRVKGDYHLLGSVEDAIEFPDAGGGSLRLGAWHLEQLPGVASVAISRGKYPLSFDELRAECGSPNISVQVVPISDGLWRVMFRMNATDMLGTAGFPVTFTFARQGKLLPVTVGQQAYVELLGPVVACPSSLLLTLARGEHIHKTIAVTRRQNSLGQVAPQITAVSPSAANTTVAWQNSSGQATVIIDYTAPTSTGTDRGDIIVEVNDHGSTYKLKVGYLAMIS